MIITGVSINLRALNIIYQKTFNRLHCLFYVLYLHDHLCCSYWPYFNSSSCKEALISIGLLSYMSTLNVKVFHLKLAEETNSGGSLFPFLKVIRQSQFFFSKGCHTFIDIMLIRKETQPFFPPPFTFRLFHKGTSAPWAKKEKEKRIKSNTSLGGHVKLYPNFITPPTGIKKIKSVKHLLQMFVEASWHHAHYCHCE